MDIRGAIERVSARESLSEAEIESVLRQIMDASATPAQIGGLLVALRMKGETVDEIVGAVRAMRAHAIGVQPRRDVVDTCGTGGDQRGTFNISTTAALIAAGAGLCVAKHGNRAMSGVVGGADVLEALGVKIDLTPERVVACIDDVGIGFLFAQVFHPAMRYAAAPRRELGVRTIFNLLGPLSNPAGARRQVIGVFSAEWTVPLAEALGRLGSQHALVVHGGDGLDEITTTAPTQVAEWKAGEISSYEIAPEQFGLPRCRIDDLIVGSREEAASAIRGVLADAAGPRRDIAVVNAAAAIYVGGKASSLAAGVHLAEDSIRSGRARRKLEQMVEFTNR